jgi:hypothetical protein
LFSAYRYAVTSGLTAVFSGPVGALVIRLMYKDRSPRVSFHALQSLWYQVAWMVILTVGWVVAGILTVVLIGFLLFPVMILLTVVPFVHMGYAAYKVSQGADSAPGRVNVVGGEVHPRMITALSRISAVVFTTSSGGQNPTGPRPFPRLGVWSGGGDP